MKKLILLLLLTPTILFAQKKPLDHSVYDEWQSVGERMISNDGRWVVYTINPQEGDGDLYIESADKKRALVYPRGYNATISEDNRFVLFKIKPRYQDYRQAKIRKKKPEDMPKDSFAIVDLTNFATVKFDRVKSFKTPEKGFGWVAIQKERSVVKEKKVTDKSIDSLKKTIDSLTILVKELKNIKSEVQDMSAVSHADSSDFPKSPKGSDLIVYNLLKGSEQILFSDIEEYEIDKQGNLLALAAFNISKDTINNAGVILYAFQKSHADTILRAINDAKNFAFAEDGSKLAFVAEHGKNKKALQKFYDLYLYQAGKNVAANIIDKENSDMPKDYAVSENGTLRFSKSGKRLLFGTAPILSPKDTSLIEIDLVKVDIWNYKDDYLQSQQLSRLSSDLKRNYLAVYDFDKQQMIQIGSEDLPTVMPTDEGDGMYFVAITDTGRRVPAQWTGTTLKDIYSVNANTGKSKLVKKDLDGYAYPSAFGKYILLYDNSVKNYLVYDGNTIRDITSKIAFPLYDERNDLPADPRPYGTLDWQDGDAFVYVYDRYDVWKVDPTGKADPRRITPNGRDKKLVYRYVKTDREEKYLTPNQFMLFDVFNETDKSAMLAETRLSNVLKYKTVSAGDYSFSRPVKAKDVTSLVYTKENYVHAPDLYLFAGKEVQLTAINPQQSQYNWGTAELFDWKAYDGNMSTGILYKPENFDSSKKYPIIFYFYERLSDRLNSYIPPAPTPSRLNISFFVSRGYLVFAPDIEYTEGHPGKSAYNYIVSAAETLAKKPWVDGDHMGIQGQSWGGYQVAHLITRTDIFKAAWAGAPVANMFSAYGGIRWQTGMNRQFQYEKTQSRIGATIWERPDLYIENSPLFHLQNVKTPLVIMHNDADGAVPWYQGIELFTAMRRLGKPVWLLNYNGEAHNLVERKNKKDIQIREQQFFDWLLKGAHPPRWITEGVKAVDKGRDWGLEIE